LRVVSINEEPEKRSWAIRECIQRRNKNKGGKSFLLTKARARRGVKTHASGANERILANGTGPAGETFGGYGLFSDVGILKKRNAEVIHWILRIGKAAKSGRRILHSSLGEDPEQSDTLIWEKKKSHSGTEEQSYLDETEQASLQGKGDYLRYGKKNDQVVDDHYF